MSTPLILSDNILAKQSFTATSTASGYSAANLVDMRGYTKWKAAGTTSVFFEWTVVTGQTLNCIGIFNSNLLSVGAVVNVYWKDGERPSDPYTQIFSQTVTSDGCYVKMFTASKLVAAGDLMYMSIAGASSAPEIAILYIGLAMNFEYPPETPYIPAVESILAESQVSESGWVLGNIVKTWPYKISARWTNVTRTWYSDTFLPWYFGYARKLQPFFYCWDLTNRASDSYFVTLDPASIREEPLTISTYVDELKLEMRGVGGL